MTDQECAQYIKALVECQARVTQGYDVELDETTVAEIASIVRVRAEQSDRIQRLEAALEALRHRPFLCWCDGAMVNPAVQGHSAGCRMAQDLTLSPESPA